MARRKSKRNRQVSRDASRSGKQTETSLFDEDFLVVDEWGVIAGAFGTDGVGGGRQGEGCPICDMLGIGVEQDGSVRFLDEGHH